MSLFVLVFGMREDNVMKERKPFQRMNSPEAWVGGVLSGLSYSLGIPVLWVRIVFLIIVFFGSASLVEHVGSILVPLYLLLWWLSPRAGVSPIDYDERTQ